MICFDIKKTNNSYIMLKVFRLILQLYFIHKRGSGRFLANSMNKEQFSLSRSFTHLLSVDSNYPLLHAVRFVSLTVQMGAFFCIGVKLSDYLSTVYRLGF